MNGLNISLLGSSEGVHYYKSVLVYSSYLIFWLSWLLYQLKDILDG